MDKEEFLKRLKEDDYIVAGSSMHDFMHEASLSARKITSLINNTYNDMSTIRKLFSELTDSKVDDTFNLFPPFYTDFGKNIKIGKNVFINSCCNFQDQGGITIGDNSLIGHQVVLATLNHDLNPSKRANMQAKPITIGKNVWIGSRSVILQGVSIGDNCVVAAGAVVTKSFGDNLIIGGVPAKVIKKIETD